MRALLLRYLQKMEAYDLYDYLAQLGYDVGPLGRAFRVRRLGDPADVLRETKERMFAA